MNLFETFRSAVWIGKILGIFEILQEFRSASSRPWIARVFIKIQKYRRLPCRSEYWRFAVIYFLNKCYANTQKKRSELFVIAKESPFFSSELFELFFCIASNTRYNTPIKRTKCRKKTSQKRFRKCRRWRFTVEPRTQTLGRLQCSYTADSDCKRNVFRNYFRAKVAFRNSKFVAIPNQSRFLRFR